MRRDRMVVLATRNPGKCREIAEVLGDLPIHVVGLDEIAREIPEPVEEGETFADNARAKALYYALATGRWALADDSGLVIDALEGAPGVRSARYAADACPAGADRETIDRANNAKVLAELQRRGVADRRATARFVCHLALADTDGVLLEACGAVEGVITRHPWGSNGFGYDPLFYVPEKGCTTAELAPEAKNAISHRGQAVREFARRLRELLNSRGS